MARARKPAVKLAVFDIDGTIFRSSLLIELVRELVRRRVFPTTVEAETERDYLQWVNRQGSYENYVAKVVRAFIREIGGCCQADVAAAASAVIDYHKHRLYRFTRDLIAQLKKEHYYLVAVSGSPHDIVELFAKAMGFRAAFGSLFEVRRGIYTGRVLKDNSARNKARVIAEFLPDFGLRADLGASIAVGDTEGDIPMLQLVGRPIAFNPNQQLAKFAIEHSIPIVVERKDVIFGLDQFRLL